MKASQLSTLLAGAATGAVLTFLAFGGDDVRLEPVAAPAPPAARAELRPSRAGRDTHNGTPAPAAREAAAPAAHGQPAAAAPVSDADLRAWLDTSLRSGYADRSRSGLAAEQLEASLGEFPGVKLAELQCGDDVCRASLRAEGGAAIDVSALFGRPPFALSSGGFSVEDADGTTHIYFVRAGQSLDALRRAARGAL